MNIIHRFFRKIKQLIKPTYQNIHKTASVAPDIMVYNPNYLVMEENTRISSKSIIMNVYAKFIMKRYSGAAVNLTVITGNHPQIPGRYYRTISKKKENLDISLYDKDVIVNEDVWIGCNVTLLSGVTIGRSSIIAAGSVVTKSMPPYCVIAGVPAKPIKIKWTIDEIIFHEQTLFSKEEQYSKEWLLEEFAKYNLKVQ